MLDFVVSSPCVGNSVSEFFVCIVVKGDGSSEDFDACFVAVCSREDFCLGGVGGYIRGFCFVEFETNGTKDRLDVLEHVENTSGGGAGEDEIVDKEKMTKTGAAEATTVSL